MSEKSPPSSTMSLDPGPSHHGRKSKTSFCTFILYGFVVIFILSICYFVTASISRALDYARSPHKSLYQNASLEEVRNRGNVVRPLVDGKQRFDVAVTVWVKDGEVEGSMKEPGGGKETPLYSDVVFKSVTLKAKDVAAVVKFDLPTAIFQGNDFIDNYDVRASFVLLPHSPSPLDQAVNFSSWYPDSITVPPVRSWPFPLRSADEGERTFEDIALDSFGISIPLIEFHEIKSKCASRNNSKATNSLQNEEDEAEDDEDDNRKEETEVEKDLEAILEEDSSDSSSDDDDDEDNRRVSPGRLLKASSSLRTTNGKSVLKNHPFLVTRTQLRLIDETRLYNRKKYNRVHKVLKSNSCGQGVDKVTPNFYMCHTYRGFSEQGNFETRFELDVGNNKTEWAYAPYLTTLGVAAGRKDIIPIPVNRENCTSDTAGVFASGPSDLPSTLLVEWRLSFSGRTPLKHAWQDLVAWKRPMNHSESDYERDVGHDSDEILNGLLGHKYNEDAHPRRRFAIKAILTILQVIVTVLKIHYWYTRSTSYSLSVPGYLMIPLGSIARNTTLHYASMKPEDLIWASHLLWVLGVALNSIALLQLKTITRAEFGWRNEGKSWIPSVSRAPATHKERASERADSRLNWMIKVGIFLTCLSFYHFLDPHRVMLISPLHALPLPTDVAHHDKPLVRFMVSFDNALQLSGFIYQRVLNARLGVFSAQYKAVAWMNVFVQVLTLVSLMKFVVGRLDVRGGLNIGDAVDLTAVGVAAWQAWTLPSMIQEEDDEATQ